MEAIDEVLQETVGVITGTVNSEGDFMKRAAATAQFYMENYEYFSSIINQLRGMMASTVPSAREKFIALHYHLASTLEREVKLAVKKGLIRDVDTELLAHIIMGYGGILIYPHFFQRQPHCAPGDLVHGRHTDERSRPRLSWRCASSRLPVEPSQLNYPLDNADA